MTEAEITQMMSMNRQAYGGWLTINLAATLATFFLAYVIRATPVFVRGAVFAVFLLTTVSLFMVMNITNDGFLRLTQDLAAVSAQTGFSQNVIQELGATPTQAGSFPIWAQISPPLIVLLNLAIGFYLLLMASWER